MTILPPPLPTEAPRARNFVARHWRGEYPLWVSYWVIGFLLQLALVGAMAVLGEVAGFEGGFNPTVLFGVIVAAWLLTGGVAVWQFVGVWRSAGRSAARRRAQGRNAGWAFAARLIIVLAVGAFVVRLGNEAAPQIGEVWNIAFRGDPDIPDYAIRTMRDGTEMEISGGIKYGLDRDLRTALAAAPGVAVIHLDSPGGRIGEALKVYETIRSHRLDTYVAHACESACTLVFLAGRGRFLQEGTGRLGFHASATIGGPDVVDEQGTFLRSKGISEAFVRRVLRTPNAEMWEPTMAELETAGFVTAVVPNDRFAISGMGAHVTREFLGSKMAELLPTMAALAAADREAFEALMTTTYEAYTAGESYAGVIETMQSVMVPAVWAHFVQASDETMRALGFMWLDVTRRVVARDPAGCYALASTADVLELLDTRTADRLAARMLDLSTQALWTSDPGHALTAQARAGARWRMALLLGDLPLRRPETDDAITAEDQEAFCRARLAGWERVMALGDDAVPLLRLVMENVRDGREFFAWN